MDAEVARGEEIGDGGTGMDIDGDDVTGHADSDDEGSGAGNANAELLKHDIMAPQLTKASDKFFKQTKAFDMFPCVEEKRRYDAYGEVIRTEDFAIGTSADTGTDPAAMDTGDTPDTASDGALQKEVCCAAVSV